MDFVYKLLGEKQVITHKMWSDLQSVYCLLSTQNNHSQHRVKEGSELVSSVLRPQRGLVKVKIPASVAVLHKLAQGFGAQHFKHSAAHLLKISSTFLSSHLCRTFAQEFCEAVVVKCCY